MTTSTTFERALEDWLEADAVPAAPQGLHATAIESARQLHQRSAWLVAVRGGTIGSLDRPAWGPSRRAIYLLATAALVLVLVALAILGGGGPRPALQPTLGRNGLISYSVNDLDQRPYSHVHVVAPDGTDDRELAEGGCGTFSADGSQLAYHTGFAETAGLVIARGDGSEPRVIPGWPIQTPILGTNRLLNSPFALSPDHTRVAWMTRASFDEVSGAVVEGNEIWVANLDGSAATLVAPKPERPGEWYEGLVWSPDGRNLAFAGLVGSTQEFHGYRAAFYIAAANGTGARRLTARLGNDSAYIAWSADGRSLAFDGLPDGAPTPTVIEGVDPLQTAFPPQDIFVLRADGTGERNVTNTPQNGEFGATWSPDGSHLAFFGGPPLPAEDAGRVATIRMADGLPAGPVVLGPGNNGTVWSPDATRLLLIRASDTSGSLRTIDPDLATEPATLLETDHGISCAAWQRLPP